MPKSRVAMVIAILSAVFLASCGEEPKTVDLSKSTDTSQFKEMLQQQQAKSIKADKSGRPITH